MNTSPEHGQTIVEYSSTKTAVNAYPDRIVSPPTPSLCCMTEMRSMGEVQDSARGPFDYRMCTTCGHTVRHFLLSSGAFLD